MHPDPQYVKDLEKLVETYQGKFEEMTIELERVNDMYWKEVNNIIPMVDSPVGCWISTDVVDQEAMIRVHQKDYRVNGGEDIIASSSEIMKILYEKEPSERWNVICEHTDARYQVEHIRTLYTSLLKMSNSIAIKSGRVYGDTVIIPMHIATALMRLDQFMHTEDKTPRSHLLRKMGTLGRFTIVCDLACEENICVVLRRGQEVELREGIGCIVYHKGLHHWYRPDGYENRWETLRIV